MIDVRCKVMIVEDAVENQSLLEGLLEDSYDLTIAATAEDCLRQVADKRPDLILLDVKLPGMSGYEVCRKLKSVNDTREIPIIFVSAATSSEDRLEGYEAGAEDYVTKPFSGEELLSKVQRSLNDRQEQMYLRNTIAEAQQVAQRALISSSELGGLNLYMQQSGNAMSIEELADSLLRATRAFGLHCSVMMVTRDETCFYGCEPESLEANLMLKLKGGERVKQVQARTILNSANCSILVKNLPMDDVSRSDELRQYLTVIMDATTARIEALQLMFDADSQRKSTIRNIIRTNDVQMVRVRDQYLSREEEQRAILQKMRRGVESDLIDMGLAQGPKWPLEKVDNGIQQFEKLPDLTREIESSFKATKAILSRLID